MAHSLQQPQARVQAFLGHFVRNALGCGHHDVQDHGSDGRVLFQEGHHLNGTVQEMDLEALFQLLDIAGREKRFVVNEQDRVVGAGWGSARSPGRTVRRSIRNSRDRRARTTGA